MVFAPLGRSLSDATTKRKVGGQDQLGDRAGATLVYQRSNASVAAIPQETPWRFECRANAGCIPTCHLCASLVLIGTGSAGRVKIVITGTVTAVIHVIVSIIVFIVVIIIIVLIIIGIIVGTRHNRDLISGLWH